MRSGSSPISHGATLLTTADGDRRGAVAFAPADQAIVGFDLDQHGGARIVPGAGIGEGLRQRGLEDMGADVPDLHLVTGSDGISTARRK